ncbi:3-demethylubiquinone-9 3-methyltransferase [Oceanicola sp. 22II-s10i]|uniref:VOC family protein n=1 Tax=Oceanicola sp. 22II-s10i TaxID=1317116 RepID=UPI000B74D4D9|nr:VOC family protein [Oceanicola sp. 22II-s10i]OWU85189.1 3-demethylubiquinone-9 3-methyltransferase [Oceanicola sp. 22II-s10i]
MQPNAIRTCLWYDNDGHEAAEFYVSLLPDSEIRGRFAPDPTKPPLIVEFTLMGAPYQILNGGPQFPHTEAASICITTEDQAETDRIWAAILAAGGTEVQCGWIRDRWGLSWQIVPAEAVTLMSRGNAGAQAAMAAMMQMVKIDVAAMRAAAEAA